jgi:hypothetical protein
MNYSFMNTGLFVPAVLLIVIAILACVAYSHYRKTRTLAFKHRFGSEYDREVLRNSSPSRAESKLADRETRVETLNIRDLSLIERELFLADWHMVQYRFVHHPKAAVTEAENLINTLLLTRGYPQAGFEQRAADVSVTYPRVMKDLRLAHAISVPHGHYESTPEELRAAMIQYRAIFDQLLQPWKFGLDRSAA